MGFFDRISEGLSRSRDKFKESVNVLLDRGPDLDEEFWDGLEETLILSDVGGAAAADIVERLRDTATRRALPDAYAVLDLLNDEIAATFTEGGGDILGGGPAVVLFVGINGTGKTTTVGKLAKAATDEGRSVILGSADTFRAAAIEQLEVWARRAGVEMVTRERGADPASVCYDTLERAEAVGAELVLIDTAGRLHTSADLMRELEKVVNVVRKRAKAPVSTVLVIDATTGQNGLAQAREFNRALDLDALIVTKLDGTAKGGIALAVSHELELPIVKIGVGEGIDDLRDFDAHEFASALVGSFDERYEDDGEVGENAKEAAISAGERRRDVIEGAAAVRAVAGEADAETVAEAGGLKPAPTEDAAAVEVADAVDGEAVPVVDEQADLDDALAAAEGTPDDDLVAAALGRRTGETIVVEDADDGSAEAEALAELDRTVAAMESDDEAPFTDDELAALALAAGEAEDAAAADAGAGAGGLKPAPTEDAATAEAAEVVAAPEEAAAEVAEVVAAPEEAATAEEAAASEEPERKGFWRRLFE